MASSRRVRGMSVVSGETECSVLRALASDLDRGDDEPVEDDEGEDGGADVIQFHPVFTYPIYGEHERVFGYKGLRIKLSYAAGSLATYFEVEYDKRVEQMETTMPLRADDVDTPMRKILSAEAVCRTREEFAQRVARDTRDFQPVGQKVHEYRQEEKGGAEDGSEGLRYEIYESGFEDDEFRKYHRRMQTMVMFFIEGAQFIDDDERWRVFTVFERLELAGSASYSLVGFCTMYRFYHWPDQRRARISQFLVLPPFQGQGHGAALYQFIHASIVASPEYADLTVEDPSEAFDDMRDRSDMRYLAAHNAFDSLGHDGAVDNETLRMLQARFKLSRRQTRRCVEMALLRKVDGRDQDANRKFRLFVKRRIYAQNADHLQGLDDDEKKTKVAESFAAVVDDYRRILSLL